MVSKKEIEDQIAENNARIQELKDEIKQLEDSQQDLNDTLRRIEKNEATTKLLNSIYEVNEDNSMCVRLDADTKTTPIMDEFSCSGKQFLIFKRAFNLGHLWMPLSLVITKGQRGVNYAYNGLTMTNLKKHMGHYIWAHTLERLDEGSRIYPLYRELAAVAEKMQECEESDIIPFQTPCMFGGQTYANQSGYGSEYYGEDLVHQGTLYGETSKFLIIGVIIEN